jgi:hypothetical protein
MDSDASYRDAGEALSFSLGTPTGAGITKKTRVVRRGSKRMREETEADEIRVRDPAVFNGAGRILLRAIVEEFNKAQAEQDAKYTHTSIRLETSPRKSTKNTTKRPRRLTKNTKMKPRKTPKNIRMITRNSQNRFRSSKSSWRRARSRR